MSLDCYLSICIVTRNRSESLERTLTSLSLQTVRPFEILVSDDSNINEEIDSVIALCEKFNCKYFVGPKLGLYSNRNYIAKLAAGTHIRTMDDDHVFPVDHVEACISAINNEPDTIWTIGEFYPHESVFDTPPPIPGQLHPRGFSVVPKDMNDYKGISCGGTIYPRSVVDLDVMNLELYKFGLIYLEYGMRLVSKGFKIKFLDSTYLIHYYDESNRSISNLEEINGSRVFSMFIHSFYYDKSLKNMFLTTAQILRELIFDNLRFSTVVRSYRNYQRITLSLS